MPGPLDLIESFPVTKTGGKATTATKSASAPAAADDDLIASFPVSGAATPAPKANVPRETNVPRATPMQSAVNNTNADEDRDNLSYATKYMTDMLGGGAVAPADDNKVVIRGVTDKGTYTEHEYGPKGTAKNKWVSGLNTDGSISGVYKEKSPDYGALKESIQVEGAGTPRHITEDDAKATIGREVAASKAYLASDAQRLLSTLPVQATDLLKKVGMDQESLLKRLTSSTEGGNELSTYYKIRTDVAGQEYEQKKQAILNSNPQVVQDPKYAAMGAPFDPYEQRQEVISQQLKELKQQHDQEMDHIHNSVFNVAASKVVNKEFADYGVLDHPDGEQAKAAVAASMRPEEIGRRVMAIMGDSTPGGDMFQKVEREKIGYQAMKYAQADAFAKGDIATAKALGEQTADANKKILDANPEYKKIVFANAISKELDTRANKFSYFFTGQSADKNTIDRVGKELGIRPEDYKDILPEDIYQSPNVIVKAAGGFLKPVIETGQAMFDVTGDKNSSYEEFWNNNAVGRSLGWNKTAANSQELSNSHSRIDTDPSSPTYGTEIPVAGGGKYNLGWNTIGSEVTNGLSMMASMALGSGEIGEALIANKAITNVNMANRAGLGIYSYITGYDKSYQKAKQTLGDDPDKEPERIGLANVYSVVDALALQLLPAKQVSDKWLNTGPATELIDLITKKGIDNVTAKMAKPYLVRALTEGFADLGKGVGVGVANVLGTTAADMAFAPQTAKHNVLDEVEESVMVGAIQMAIPTIGGGFLHAKHAGPMFKRALYEVGTNPDPFIADVKRQLQEQKITPDEAQKRIDAIKNIVKIQRNVPTSSPLTNENLTQQQQMDYAANLLTEEQLAAQKANTTDQVQANILAGQIGDLQAEREDLLHHAGAQPSPGENKIKISDIIGHKVNYNGEPATVSVDGSNRVILTNEKTGVEYDNVGNILNVGDQSVGEFGIDPLNSVVKVNDAGHIEVRGREYFAPQDNPLSAINYHNEPGKKGIPVSVTLEHPLPNGGTKKVTFRGDVAEDIRYQLHLQKLDKENSHEQLENFINTDEESKAAMETGGLEKASEESAAENNGSVSPNGSEGVAPGELFLTNKNTSEDENSKKPQAGTSKKDNGSDQSGVVERDEHQKVGNGTWGEVGNEGKQELLTQANEVSGSGKDTANPFGFESENAQADLFNQPPAPKGPTRIQIVDKLSESDAPQIVVESTAEPKATKAGEDLVKKVENLPKNEHGSLDISNYQTPSAAKELNTLLDAIAEATKSTRDEVLGKLRNRPVSEMIERLQPKKPHSFETAKGSQYVYDENGNTQRVQSNGDTHEKQDLTVFSKFENPDQEQRFLGGVQNSEKSGTKVYVIDQEGKIYDTNEEVKGKDVRLALVDTKTGKVLETVDTKQEPTVGYSVFDQRRFEKDGQSMREKHIGNPVAKINYSAEEAAKSKPAAKPEPVATEAKPEPAKPAAKPEPQKPVVDSKEEADKFFAAPHGEREVEESKKVGDNIKQRFKNAIKLLGHRKVEVLHNGQKVSGRYVLTTDDAVTPSHNAKTFGSSEGFPMLEDGRNPNDRDYTKKENKDRVTIRSEQYDGRAVQNVPTVDKNGVVINGNDRTMSGQLAAERGTDTEYIQALKDNAEVYGFTAKQIDQMVADGKHPRLIFVPDKVMPYDTNTFLLFNPKTEGKAKSPIEEAISYGRTVDTSVLSGIGRVMNGFDSLAQFFASRPASKMVRDILQRAGIFNADNVTAYYREGKFTNAGKEMLQNIILGKVFSEETLHLLEASPIVREKVVYSMGNLLSIQSLGEEYSLQTHLSDALHLKDRVDELLSGIDQADIAKHLKAQGLENDRQAVKKYGLQLFLQQGDMFGGGKFSEEAIKIWYLLEDNTKKAFRDFTKEYHENAKHYSQNAANDIFGNVRPSREELINNYNKKVEEYEATKQEGVAGSPKEANPVVDAGKVAEGADGGIRGGGAGKEKNVERPTVQANEPAKATPVTTPAAKAEGAVDFGGGLMDAIPKDKREGVQVASISDLKSIRQQGPSNYDHSLLMSMEKDGIKEPLHVIYYPEEGVYALSDGHHRLDTAEELAADNLPIRISEAAAHMEPPKGAKHIDFKPLDAPAKAPDAKPAEPKKAASVEPAQAQEQVTDEYANFLLNEIDERHKAKYKNEDIKTGLTKLYHENLKSGGQNRANSKLEDTLMNYIPEFVRAEAYQQLRAKFEREQAEKADTETPQEKATRLRAEAKALKDTPNFDNALGTRLSAGMLIGKAEEIEKKHGLAAPAEEKPVSQSVTARIESLHPGDSKSVGFESRRALKEKMLANPEKAVRALEIMDFVRKHDLWGKDVSRLIDENPLNDLALGEIFNSAGTVEEFVADQIKIRNENIEAETKALAKSKNAGKSYLNESIAENKASIDNFTKALDKYKEEQGSEPMTAEEKLAKEMEDFDWGAVFAPPTAEEIKAEEAKKAQASAKEKAISDHVTATADKEIAAAQARLDKELAKPAVKDNKGIVSVGDELDGRDMSIGAINRRKRDRKIQGEREAIEIAKRAKQVAAENGYNPEAINAAQDANRKTKGYKNMSSNQKMAVDAVYERAWEFSKGAEKATANVVADKAPAKVPAKAEAPAEKPVQTEKDGNKPTTEKAPAAAKAEAPAAAKPANNGGQSAREVYNDAKDLVILKEKKIEALQKEHDELARDRERMRTEEGKEALKAIEAKLERESIFLKSAVNKRKLAERNLTRVVSKDLAAEIRSHKIEEKPSDGKSRDIHGNEVTRMGNTLFTDEVVKKIGVKLHNAALEVAARAVELGHSVKEAIQAAVDYIHDHHFTSWNEKMFRDNLGEELNIQTAEDLRAKKVSEEPLSEKNKKAADMLISSVREDKNTLSSALAHIDALKMDDATKKKIKTYIRNKVTEEIHKATGEYMADKHMRLAKDDHEEALRAMGDEFDTHMINATSQEVRDNLRSKYAAAKSIIQSKQTAHNVANGIVAPSYQQAPPTGPRFQMPSFSRNPVTGKLTAKGKFQKAKSELATAVQDRYSPLERAQEGSLVRIVPENDAVTAMRLKKSKAWEKISQLRDYMGNMEHKKGSLFDRMKKAGISLDKFGLYLYAKHAEERNEYNARLRQRIFDSKVYELNQKIADAQGKPHLQKRWNDELQDILQQKDPRFALMPDGGSGMTNQQARDILDEVELDPKKAEYEAFEQEFRDNVVNKILESKHEAGMISDEDFDHLKNYYKNYVPLKVKDEVILAENGGEEDNKFFSNSAINGRELYRSKGANFRDVMDRNNPLLQAAMDLEHSYVKGEDNRANTVLSNFVKMNPNENIWEVQPAVYDYVHDANGNVVKAFEKDETRPNNGIPYYENGKKQYIVLRDKNLVQMNKKIGNNAFLRVAQPVSHFIAQVNTLSNPEFFLKNVFFDQQDAYMSLLGSDNPELVKKFRSYNPAKVAKEILANNGGEWAKWVQEWKDQGGSISFVEAITSEKHTELSNKVFEGYDKPLSVSRRRAILEKFKDYATSLEQTTRVMAYRAAVEGEAARIAKEENIPVSQAMKQVNRDKAAVISRNATVDFEKKGVYGAYISAFKAFANAGVQGTTNLMYMAAKSPKVRKFLGAMVMAGVAEAEIARMLGDCNPPSSEDCYLGVPDWRKARNFMVPLKPLGGKGFLSIPVGRNFGWFNYVGKKLDELLHGEIDKSEFFGNSIGSILDYYDPTGGTQPIEQKMTGNAAPVVQLATNKNHFGTPIEPDNRSGAFASENFFPTTPEAFVDASHFLHTMSGGNAEHPGKLEISPDRLEFVMQSIFGGLGNFAGGAYQSISDVSKGRTPQPNDIPVARTFYRTSNMSRVKQEYGEIAEKSKQEMLSDKEKEKLDANLRMLVEGGHITEYQAEKRMQFINSNQNKVKSHIGKRMDDGEGTDGAGASGSY